MFYLRATYCKTEVILFQEREKISLSNEFSCAEKVKFPSFFWSVILPFSTDFFYKTTEVLISYVR